MSAQVFSRPVVKTVTPSVKKEDVERMDKALLVGTVAHTPHVVPITVTCAQFSPDDNSTVFTGTKEGSVVKWMHVDTEPVEVFILHDMNSTIRSISANGSSIIACSNNRKGMLWEVTDTETVRIEIPTDEGSVVQFSNQKRSFSFVMAKKKVIGLNYWRILPNSHQLEVVTTAAFRNDVSYSIMFSLNEQFLAAGCQNFGKHTVRLYDIDTSDLKGTLEGHTDIIVALDFNHNNTLLASGSYDKTVRIWNVVSSRLVRIFSEHCAPVLSVKFMPDSDLVLSGSLDGVVKSWDANTGTVIQSLYLGSQVNVLCFSPNCELVAGSHFSHVLNIWHVGNVGAKKAKQDIVNCENGSENIKKLGMFYNEII